MNYINYLRQEYTHYNQSKFAEKIGKTKQDVWRWENGLRSPTNSTLAEICNKLNLQFFPEKNGFDKFDLFPVEKEVLVTMSKKELVIETNTSKEETIRLLKDGINKLRTGKKTNKEGEGKDYIFNRG